MTGTLLGVRMPRTALALPTGGRIAAALVLLAAIALAATSFQPIHRSPALIVAVTCALAGGTLVAVVGAVLRWKAWAVGLATIGVYLVLGVPAAVPGRALGGVVPTVPGLVDLVSGAALSWKQLLTVSLPVGDYQALLIPVYLLTLVLTVVGLTLALRTRGEGLAALAPIALLVAGIAFGPGDEAWPSSTAVVLFVLLVLYLVLCRRGRAAPRRRMRSTAPPTAAESGRTLVRSAGGLVVVLAVAAAGAAVLPALAPPSSSRDVLRQAVDVPFDPNDFPSPLSAFRRYFGALGDETVLTVSGARSGDHLRIAALDTYDGVVFSVGAGDLGSAAGTFARQPSPLDRSAVQGRAEHVDVEVGAYQGVWVPNLGAVSAVRFSGTGAAQLEDSYYFNAGSSTGAVLGGLPPGSSYTVDTVVPDFATAEEVADLSPGGSPVPAPAVVPDGLDAAVDSYAGGAERPGERLAAVLEGIRADGYVSHGGPDEPFSRSGHSANRISELLSAEPMLGDAEQYAVLAALAADRVGFPARVVVGFVVPDAAGSAEVTGDDATAWIEVDVAGRGWVAIDPNPELREIPAATPEDATNVSRPRSVVQPPVEDRVEPEEPLPPEVAETDQDEGLPAWLDVLLAIARVLGWILLALAILVAPFLGIVGAKALRRRRRRQVAEPLGRIAAGWREFTDAAVDYGVAMPATATRNEVAIAAGGREPIVVAVMVDRATFAPGGVDDETADRIWESVDRITAQLGEGRTRWERWKARVSLRSLRPRAPRTPPSAS